MTLGRAICIITGASKGFGRALAHEVSDQLLEKNKIRKKVCVHPGVPLAEAWLYPPAGDPLSDSVAEIHGGTAGGSLHSCRSEHKRGGE